MPPEPFEGSPAADQGGQDAGGLDIPGDESPFPSESGFADEGQASLPPLPSPGTAAEPGMQSDDYNFDGTLAGNQPQSASVPPENMQATEPGSNRPAHEMDQTGVFSAPDGPSEMSEEGGFELEATLREDTGPDPFGIDAGGMQADLPSEPASDTEWGNIPIDGQASPDLPESDLGLAGSSGYSPPPPVPVEEPVDQDPFDLTGEPSPETTAIPTYKPAAKSSGGGKKILFTLLLLAALGAGGYYSYPMVMDIINLKTQQPAGTLTPANVQVKALTRTDGRIIYLVRGVVKNESSGNVGMVQVEAQFRNSAGDVLSKSTSYCGNVFEDNQLVNLDLEKVRSDLQNELGQSLSNSSISPGQTVPFLVILDNPPAGIDRVTVTIPSFKETT
jgi:hypothetical protein